MTTIQQALDSIPGRAIPKCPCTFALYRHAEVLPNSVIYYQTDTVVGQDEILNVVETNETIAFVDGAWRVIGTTAEELTAFLLCATGLDDGAS